MHSGTEAEGHPHKPRAALRAVVLGSPKPKATLAHPA